MDWFRSHHGAPTDPKWLTIARRAKVRPGDVASVVWALFDHASQNQDRGSISGFDPEPLADFYGYEVAEVEAIVSALRDKGVIINDRFAAWDRRQPKREDETAAERKRAQRERDKAKMNPPCDDDTGGHDASRDVTLDKRRLEGEDKSSQRRTSAGTSESTSADPAMIVVKAFMAERNARWPEAMPANHLSTQAVHAKAFLAEPGATPELVSDLIREAVASWKDPVPPGGVGAFRTSIPNRIAQHVRAGTRPASQAARQGGGASPIPIIIDRNSKIRDRLRRYRRDGKWDYGGDPDPTSPYCGIPRNVLIEEMGLDWVNQHHGVAA